jgi:formyl-CoA transferase
MYAAQGILAALYGRARGRKMRRVEVNMLEASIAFTPDSFAMSNEGHDVDRLTRVRASQSFAMTCSDAKVVMVHLSSAEKFWDALMRAVDDPQLSGDPRFQTRQKRYENYPELQLALAEVFSTRTLSDWSARLSGEDVPFSPALTTEEVPNDAQVRHLGTFTSVRAADDKSYRIINSPVRFEGRLSPVRRAPPLLNQDADTYLDKS